MRQYIGMAESNALEMLQSKLALMKTSKFPTKNIYEILMSMESQEAQIGLLEQLLKTGL